MIFERIRTVPTADELLDKAYSRAARAGRGKIKEVTDRRELEESMLLTAGNIIADNLRSVVNDWPNLDELGGFYRDVADILVGVERLKMALASVDWAASKVKELSRRYVGIMRKSEDPVAARKQAYGRMSSIVYDVDEALRLLNDARNRLRDLPDIKVEPTIVVAGYPNVGKSSFVAKTTGARPEIAQYPFTTKKVTIGHFVYRRRRYQVIDTPGLLDRPLKDRNDIERQAIAALTNVGDVILFIIDPSETCGYSLDEQYGLLGEIKRFVKIPVLVAANKVDVDCRPVEADVYMSTLTGEGVMEARNRLVDMIEKKEAEAILPPSRKRR